MTVFLPSPSAERFRGVASPDLYEQTPVEARDISLANVIHWSQPPGSQDPFLAGAYWALSWSLELIFGDTLGALLNAATVANVERWNGSAWEQVA